MGYLFIYRQKDILDGLSADQLKELNKAIKEADNKEVISWNEFKREMGGWQKNNPCKPLRNNKYI